MEELKAILDVFFGWGFVVGAVLLLVAMLFVIRSTFAFKHAKIIKGKIVQLSRFAGESLPTIQFDWGGKTRLFRSKTQIKDLHVGSEVDLQLARSSVRLYEKDKVDRLPKPFFLLLLLFLFFLYQAVSFLLLQFS